MASKAKNPFKRESGTYTFYYYVEGEKRYRSGYKTYKEAVAEMKRITALVTLGEYIPTNATCSDYVDLWFEKKQPLKYSTYKNYQNAIRHIKAFMKKRKLENVTRTTIVKLYEHVCSYSPSTAKMVKTVMNGVFDMAIEAKHVRVNYPRLVRLPTQPAQRPKVQLSKQEIEALIVESKGTTIHLAIILAVLLGVRRGELWGLRFSDVDYEHKELRVRRALGRTEVDSNSEAYLKQKAAGAVTKQVSSTKTDNGYRPIPLSNYVLNEIEVQKRICDENRKKLGKAYNKDGYILCDEKGDPRCSQYHYTKFKRILDKVGIDKMRWHDLREVNASYLHDAGISSKAVARVLGHADDIVTGEKYLNTTNKVALAVDFAAKTVFGAFDIAPATDSPPGIFSSNAVAPGMVDYK